MAGGAATRAKYVAMIQGHFTRVEAQFRDATHVARYTKLEVKSD